MSGYISRPKTAVTVSKREIDAMLDTIASQKAEIDALRRVADAAASVRDHFAKPFAGTDHSLVDGCWDSLVAALKEANRE